MKKLLLLSIASLLASVGAVTGLKLKDSVKEELNTKIIVQLDSAVGKKTTPQIYAEQNQVLSSIKNGLGVDYKLDTRFSVALNAFVINVNSAHVSAIRNLPNVKDVNYDQFHEAKEEESTITSAPVISEKTDNISKQTMEIPDETNEGEGTLIAILDSSFMINATYKDSDKHSWTNVTHAAYTELDSTTAVRYTEESIKAVIDANPSFHGKANYYNNKVPFFYDYGGDLKTEEDDEEPEEDLDVFNKASDHGNHVATIAAGNDPLYKGIAPKAQLLLMKVFTISKDGTSVGARDVSILKALEDCAILGADVANMSLGSALTDFRDDTIAQRTVKILQNKGIVVNASAGNEGRDSFWNTIYEYSTLDTVELGILGSYANNASCMTIGSGEPDLLFYSSALTLGTNIIPYSDQYVQARNETYKNDLPLSSLLPEGASEGTFPWVRVPGLGDTTDYADIDAKGKIAIVDRGDLTFAQKVTNAQKAGAIAIGIIDNDPSAVDFNFTMALGDDAKFTIPVISILYKDRETFDNSEETTLKISLNVIDTNNKARQISSFSSDGPTSDLSIKPDVSAPGSNILGGVYASGPHSYDYYSGTSMSCPNATGVYALLLSEHLDDAEWKAKLNDRIMSSATPMIDKYGTNIEPVRKQGAGLINVDAALNTNVVLDGSNDPENLLGRAKIELRNNDDIKKGKINLNFTAISYANSDITYEAKTYIYRPRVTDAIDTDRYDKKFEGLKVIANQDELIEVYTSSLVVKPGSNSLNITRELSGSVKNELNSLFENGCYIEGFVVLSAQNQPEISIPYLGFYGDYSKGEPIEPFIFERDNSVIYQSDILNEVGKVNAELNEINYSSDWVTGYWSDLKNIDLSYFIQNKTALRDLKDDNFSTVNPVGMNPYTGEYETTDIYMGNNGYSNTMIISQYVNRSIQNNYITITNKATGEQVLLDHMFDSFFGSFEDDEGNESWPLCKSLIDDNYWKTYMAHRAYTIIPLYNYEYNEDTEEYTYGEKWADGEYEIYFNYTLASGGTYEKRYTLHIDSQAPVIKSFEDVKVNGVDCVRVRFEELRMVSASVNSNKVEVKHDSEGYYVDLEKITYASGDKIFVKATDFACGISNNISHLSDKYHVSISCNSFINSNDFTSNLVFDNDNNSLKASFTYTKNKKNAKIDDNINVFIDLSSIIGGSNIVNTVEVYEVDAEGNKTKVENAYGVGSGLRFTGNSNSTFEISYTTAAKPAPAPTSKGCGGTIEATSVLLTSIAAIGLVLVFINKKRKHI